MSFDSLDNVIAFQGEDYEAAYVPEEARKLLEALGRPLDASRGAADAAL